MSGREMTDAASVGMGEHRSAWVTDPTPAPQHPHTTQEPREAAQIPLGDLILAFAGASAVREQVAEQWRQGKVSRHSLNEAALDADRSQDAVFRRLAEVAPEETGAEVREPGRCPCGSRYCSDAAVRL